MDMSFRYSGKDGLPTMEMPMNMTMMMREYFFFSTDIKDFLFEGLHFKNTGGVIGCCVMLFVLTVLLEGGKSFVYYLQLRLKQHPLTYGKSGHGGSTGTMSSINHDRSAIFSALLIPASVGEIKKQRIKYHFGSYMLHTINLLLGYLLMLAVMSYDAYILFAVILGSGVGYFIFGAINARNKVRFNLLQDNVYDKCHSNMGLGLSTSDMSVRGSDIR